MRKEYGKRTSRDRRRKDRMSGVSKEAMYNPEQALHELMLQEQVVNQAVDVQVLLRILVDKGIITREEVAEYRQEVRNSPKYAEAIRKIEAQKMAFEKAKDDPNGYLKALLNAKLNGKL